MAEHLVTADVEALLVAALPSLVGVPSCSTRPPRDGVEEHVQVVAGGGYVAGVSLGIALVTVHAWAQSEGRASEICRRAVGAIESGLVPSCRCGESTSLPYANPHPDYRMERYTGVMQVRVPRAAV